MSYQQEKFKEIADKIREKTGTTESIKPIDFKDEVGNVFDAGKEAEKRERWSKHLDALNNDEWVYGFSGSGWNDETFTPYTDLTTQKSVNVSSMFYRANITDMKGIFEKYGTSFDLSECPNITYLFAMASVTRLPKLVFNNSTHISSLFSSCEDLQSVDELVIPKGIADATKAFQNCTSLTEIRISGEIKVSLDLHWSPLSKESIESIVSALSDTASGQAVTFSLNAVNNAFTEEEWESLISAKKNWTFALV